VTRNSTSIPSLRIRQVRADEQAAVHERRQARRQLDVSVKKIFRVGRREFQGQVALFNALNGNVVLAENEQFGTRSANHATSCRGGCCARPAPEFLSAGDGVDSVPPLC
jgi:hypothetical protein